MDAGFLVLAKSVLVAGGPPEAITPQVYGIETLCRG
jgi:hypothetical protein